MLLILSHQLNMGLLYFALESPCILCSCLLNAPSVTRVTYEAGSPGVGVIPNICLYVVIIVIVYTNYGGWQRMNASCVVGVYFPVRTCGRWNCCFIVYVGNICERNTVTINLSVNAIKRWRSECNVLLSGFGGLEVACWPLVPKFAGSNPTEAVGFFRAKKSSARLPSEGEVKPSVPCRRFTDPWMLRGSRAFSGRIHCPFLAHVIPPLAARISWRRPVAKVGTFENKKVHKHLHLWPLGPHIRRLAVRSGTSKGSTISQYGCSTFGALATEAQ